MLRIHSLLSFACVLTCSVLPLSSQTAKPKVRALTAFVHIDRTHFEAQIGDALTMLRDAKRAYEQRGYEVQTIRITTQPFSEIIQGLSETESAQFFHALNALATRESFIPNIGPAMLNPADPPRPDQLARILAENDQLNSSIIVAGEDGLRWPAIRAAARVMKYLSEHTPHSDGNFRFVATAMLGPYGPFFPGSYHTGAGRQFSVGLESANLVETALAAHPGHISLTEKNLAADLSLYAVECEQIAREIEKRSGWTYAGLDPTPAPAGEISIGDAIEKFTGAKFGSSGTMTAAAMITRAVKSVPVKQVGYAGLMVPVLEDSTLAQRWSEGTFNIDSLLSYSAVCGTGLDTVPLPGDVSEDQLARIIGDMATLAFKWHKPLSARLLPVAGKKAGDKTEFNNPHLVDAVIQKLP
ncbi:MAG TPA: DUF711 family protein [Terriglobales bacterium]|nr:DUF711 family protein [Terriglobales bacterium]